MNNFPFFFIIDAVNNRVILNLSPPIPLRLYTLPYWSNPPFLIFKIRALALSPERQSAQMLKIKNGGLDQYGTGPFELQQFGTAGVEAVNVALHYICLGFMAQRLRFVLFCHFVYESF